MADLGAVVVLAALIVAVFGVAASLIGHRRGIPALVISGRRAALSVGFLVVLATIALIVSFVTNDFSVRYVAERSSLETTLSLKIVAFYAGQAGSLLYWTMTLSIFTAVVVLQNRRRHPDLMPYVTAVLLGIQAYFLFLLGFVDGPFERLPYTPPNGLGMMPLLEDPGMIIHPPMLLAGYMSWAVPFAFGIAALASGRLDSEWIRTTRYYAIFAWLVLGAGNLLGSWWAYHVLGWGGYWGWDPVENAAILPWFIGTAYLHSVMITERRGMLKVWTMALLIITFHLSIYGTFVVRSGLITSVHSFALSSVGPYFLAFLAASLIGSLALFTRRLPAMRSDNEFEFTVSREGAFLLNNLILVAITFATFWGSIFPLVSELVRGVRITVAKPFFDQINGPMLLALIVLMGIGPLLPWRRASRQLLWKNFAPPVIATGVLALALFAIGVHEPLPLIAFASCGFVAFSVALEYYRGVVVRRRAGQTLPRSVVNMITVNRHRYGGYIVHIGIILIGIAVVGSNFYQLEKEVVLDPGQATRIGRYTITYNGLNETALPDRRIVSAHLSLTQDGRPIGEVEPGRSFRRNFERQPTSLLVIRSDLREDLYILLASWDADGKASFFIYVNPLVMWLWIGGVVLILGGLVTIWPERSLQPALATAPAVAPAGAGATADA